MSEERIPLEEALKNPEKYFSPKREFKTGVFYNEGGLQFEVYWENKGSYGDWQNHDLTLFRDRKTNRVIGAEVPCSKKLIENDAIEIFWEEKPNIAEEVDKYLTLYRASNQEVVGMKISKIEELVKQNE